MCKCKFFGFADPDKWQVDEQEKGQEVDVANGGRSRSRGSAFSIWIRNALNYLVALRLNEVHVIHAEAKLTKENQDVHNHLQPLAKHLLGDGWIRRRHTVSHFKQESDAVK